MPCIGAVKVVCQVLVSFLFLLVDGRDLFSQPTLIGRLGLDELLMTDHRQWFEAGYSAYQPDLSVLQSLPDYPESVTIRVIFGTWCSDSRQLIPAFFKVIDLWHFDHRRIDMILVDHHKQVKLRGYQRLRIASVPTIIFYDRRGREAGRIVESVPISIELSIKQILEHIRLNNKQTKQLLIRGS